MMLRSRLFRGVAALENCLVRDSAHVTPGTIGEHVQLIQRALVYLGNKGITGGECRNGIYGATTAAAVLAFKRQPLSRIQHTIKSHPTVNTTKATIIKAVNAAGAGGKVIINVGHGAGSGELGADVGAYRAAT